jgi:ureidoglycolate lyase
MIELRPEPLIADAFRPFGDVIEAGDAYELINSGTTRKFADLANIDVSAEGGRPCISIYRATPYKLPLTIRMLERHPLGTQLFMPLHRNPFLIVVAPAGDSIDVGNLRAFMTGGHQGINYRRGVWHHPLIALRNSDDFVVVDRLGPASNCDEMYLDGQDVLLRQ